MTTRRRKHKNERGAKSKRKKERKQIHTSANTNLHELEVGIIPQFRVLLEEGERVLGRAERVHQHEADVALERLPHLHHLLGREVEEAVVSLDWEQRLGLVQSHGGAQPTVELQDDRLWQVLLSAPAQHPELKSSLTCSFSR